MKFIIDENAHHGLVPFLDELKHDGEISPKGLSNGEVLAAAISKNRVLLTHDKDFLTKQITVGHPGIILVRIRPENFEGIKLSLARLLSEKPSAELFSDKLFLLFENRHEEIPFRFWEIPP